MTVKLRSLQHPALIGRYFTTPLVLLALHLRPPSTRRAVALAVAWSAVDAGTAWMFLARPFYWPDGSVARFMW